MANICTTEWKVTGTREAVTNLWEAISQFDPDNKDVYLHNLATHYGIDYESKGISVRGNIYFAEYDEDNNILSFDTESAWTATEDLFNEINRVLGNALEISYREMECGNDIFYVKDMGDFFPEECCVDSNGEPFDGECYTIFTTKEEAIQEWCEKMDIKRGTRNTQQMLDYIEEYEYGNEDTYFYIHCFTFA